MTTRTRLHVHKITSIGAVESGDNPEADILFWKAQGPKASGPTAKATGRGRGAGSGRPRPLTAVETVAVMKRLDHLDKRLESIAKGTPVMTRTDPPVRNSSSAQILARVDAMANEIRKSQGTSPAAARAEVWRSHPEMKTEIRKAQRLERGSSPSADQSVKSISDRVSEVITEATRRASWQPLLQGWGNGQTRDQILAKVRVEVWHSPDGEELRDLERAFGAKPYTPATSSEIRKSRGGDRYARALNLLDSGIWEQ